MGIYRRPNSPYWWASLGRPGEGPIRVSTKIPLRAATPEQTDENRRLALAAYNSMMGDLARDRFALPSTTLAPTFDTYLTWYAEHHVPTHARTTQLREQRIFVLLRHAFGRLRLPAITKARWQEYVTTRTRAGVSVATIGRELAVLKAVLNTAVGEHLEYSPIAHVERKGTTQPPKRTITKVEEPTFLKALRARDRELADMYLVGVGTLLRFDNLLTLRRRDHHGGFLFVQTKTGPHQVPLTGPTALQRRAAQVLRRRMPKAADGLFFPAWHARFAGYDDPGHPRVGFLRKVRAAAKTAGLPWGLKHGGIVWHTATRATGATRMMREHQIDVRTVQIVGGWRSLDQMAAYLGIALDLHGLAEKAV